MALHALARDRQTMILAELRRAGTVRVSDLTRRLRVSDMTIRRDLDGLAAAGVLQRVYGGAVLLATAPPLLLDEAHSSAAPLERALARTAARLVRPDIAVGLSAGPATALLADELARFVVGTVVTNSVPAASAFAAAAGERRGPSLLLTGGRPAAHGALVGPFATASWRAVSLDVAFVGVHGLSAAAGLSTHDLDEGETNRALVYRAARVVVLATSSVWDRASLSSFAALREVDMLVTDEGLLRHETACAELAAAGVEVLFCEPVTRPSGVTPLHLVDDPTWAMPDPPRRRDHSSVSTMDSVSDGVLTR